MIDHNTHPWTRMACDADAQNWHPELADARIELSDAALAKVDGDLSRELRRDLVVDSRGRVWLERP